MSFATPTTGELTELLARGGTNTLTDRDATEEFIHGLLDAGVPLLPLRTDAPNQKHPDVAGGFNAATTDTSTWNTWLDERFGRPRDTGDAALGLGMRVGARMIVVDVDTPEERVAWDDFRESLGITDSVGDTPTVTSPGTVDATGADVHHGGGHWYFRMSPDAPVPAGLVKTLRVDAQGRTDDQIPTHQVTDPDTGQTVEKRDPSFALLLTTAYVVIPPTVRDEGPYTFTGEVHDIPDALMDWMRTTADKRRGIADEQQRARAERRMRPRTDSEAALDTAIDDWAESTSWSDILTPLGWAVSGTDHCGCEQWLRPGSTSTKSATAHECAHGTYLKVWTDNAGHFGLHKDDALSKMQAYAATAFGGDIRAALTHAGISAGLSKVSSRAFDLRERVRAIVAERDSSAAGAMIPTAPADGSPADYDTDLYPEGHPNDPALMEAIFNFNNTTRAIFHAARRRPVYTSPMALLFAELFSAGRASGEHTRTEIDDPLSMYLAFCARSGGGKSVGMKLIQKGSIFQRTGFPKAKNFRDNLESNGGDSRPKGDLVVAGLASGQAMVDGLASEGIDPHSDDEKPEKVLLMRSPAVLTVVEDELDNLAAKSQQGSTLSNAVLSAWSCDTIGDLSRTHGERMINGTIDPYTVFLAGGIQPARASSLVGRGAVASGLAQRVFFMATEDPWYVDSELGIDVPERSAVVAEPVVGPESGDDPVGWNNDDHRFTLPAVPVGVQVGFCDDMHRAVRIQNLRTARGDQDPGETHLTRIRIRLACLMAIHSGQTQVSPEVWEWSADLMEHRRQCYAFAQRGAKRAAQDEVDEKEIQTKRGRETAERVIGREQQATMEAAQAIAPRIPVGGVSRRDLRDSLPKSVRDSLPDALEMLEIAGNIRIEKGARGKVTVYPA